MVTRELPASVYRCKGIIYTDDAPHTPYALQVVGRRTQLVEVETTDPEGTSSIVAIGRSLDTTTLDLLFKNCLTDDPRPS